MRSADNIDLSYKWTLQAARDDDPFSFSTAGATVEELMSRAEDRAGKKLWWCEYEDSSPQGGDLGYYYVGWDRSPEKDPENAEQLYMIS